MKYYREIIIVILILLIGAFYVLHTETSNSAELKIKGLKSDVKTLQASETHYKLITDSLKNLIPTIKEKHIVNEAKADKPILKLKERIAENRPEVMQEIDSMAIVKAFVGDLDSLNMAQENKINMLKSDHQEDLIVLNAIVESQDSTISKQDSIIVKQDEIITDQDKEIKKRKHGGKLLKIAVPVALLLGILIGL
jgi:predicted RND superfamily exporter protein